MEWLSEAGPPTGPTPRAEPGLAPHKPVVWLHSGSLPFVPGANRAKNPTPTFNDFHSVFTRLVHMLNIRLQCLLVEALALTSECNLMW